eukprot:scaffold1820_cov129-Cylindrotheca_fusiformis.AAC.14
MGSSHSAPRRRRDERGPTTRRPRRRISQDSATSSPSSASASFSGDFDQQPPVTTLSQRLPVNEELPSLLEEAGSNHSQRSRLDSSSGGGMDFVGNNSQQQQQQLEQPSRLTRLTGLSVIQSNRQLEEYEMNESFTLDDDAPSGGGARTDTGGPEFISPPGGMDTPTYLSATSSVGNDYAIETMTPSSDPAPDFVPQGSRNSEWMGRSIETLVLGYASAVPILCLPEDEDDQNEDLSFWGPTRRRSTVSTLGSSSEMGRRSSLQSFQEHRRGSLVGSGNMHGGTLANYYSRRRQAGDGSGPSSRRGSLSSTANRRGTASSAPLNRRGSTSHGPSYRRRLSMTRSASGDSEDGRLESRGGPNITLSLIARETTGRLSSRNRTPASKRLKQLGGHELFSTLDRPAGGMCSEVAFLSEVIDSGDWAETQTVISRIAPRLIGDPMAAAAQAQNGEREAAIDDPNLPPTAPRFYAGGGRLGLERDAFVQAGGIDVLIRIFKEPSFVGAEMAQTYDARDLTEELVAIRLAQCWNEVMASLRELVYAMPSVVENGDIFDNGGFLPFLFSLLSHDSCFDGAAALIEEILSLQSHSAPQQLGEEDNMDDSLPGYHPSVRVALPTTFFLGNVPDLYKLWNSFSCRQLAHFCRILALLVFEPEDRQLLESPAVLKSIELLQLRRNRAARAGRDSTVDLNQSILLGDENLTRKLLKLLSVMNYAPNLRRTNAYHVMAHFPFIADTLVMLGLNELTNWKEIDRLEKLARTLLSKDGDDEDEENRRHVNELGKVADMLENTSSALMANSQGGSNQLGQIIHIISVAQQHGVVPGASRRRRQSQNGEDPEAEAIDGFASATGMLTDQVMGRRSVFVQNSNSFGSEEDQAGDSLTGLPTGQNRPRINTPQDAANALQFNALLLGLYQVEVLFVLCTLLGGRRKIDSQQMLNSFGVIPVLEDMFQRLPWAATTPPQQATSSDTGQEDPEDSSITPEDEALPSGIHGPGCECTPESAFCVQYLRLLHNFCDRDCDNYGGRRLLLSDEERRFIFGENTATDAVLPKLKPGLLSKITTAFIGESDESPYRFWLASCVESYLRGSSTSEQLFVAKLGLLKHLIRDITSDFLHCAGSLQTSFDLLGELCKGNAEVIRLLVKDLDEESFRKLMSVAAANLVDSNVFIRSLLLSLERMSSSQRLMPLHLDPECFDMRQGVWKSQNGIFSRSYLTHSWWDTHMVDVDDNGAAERSRQQQNEFKRDASRSSDWFPTIGTVKAYKMRPPGTILDSFQGLHNGVGHFGWVFTPEGETLRAATHEPNTVERLSWFLASNQTRLLRDLLGVVDLKNINHENICCLNTAVVIAIFAYRRGELHSLLQDLGRLNIEEREIKRRALNAVKDDNVIDRAFVQAMKYMDLEEKVAPAPYGRRASLTRRVSLTYYGTKSEIGDKNDVMRNFREVLWFWIEYYTHRGRDRLSLEYSSHLRFQEWVEVVYLLGADDGAPTSLVSAPVRLPRSPYQRSARMPEPLTRL